MASVECLQEAVLVLVAARQALHAYSARLVSRQQQLSHALIDRYLRRADA
jgi:hypothetical protein